MSNPIFADLSNNNSGYNAEEYRKAGHVIVALKASEGTFFIDSKHRGWALQSGLHHIAVIHYHFGRPDRSSGKDEADFFLHATNGLRGPHDFLVYDGERASNGAFGLDPAHAREFDQRIQERTRFHTILYASASELAAHGKDALVGDNKRDWCADYSTNRDTHAEGHVCVMRQFTDGVFGPEPHAVAGIGRCDVDILRGEFAKQVLSRA